MKLRTRLCYIYGLLQFFQIVGTNGQTNPGEPLFLTPYINSGQIIEAKRISAVENLPFSVESYSGLITVDEANGAHTFFWFFPAKINPETAPVLLWFEGGPGVSTFFSIFVEHGPYSVKDKGLELRDITWTQNHSIIYVDQPNDVGYSFAELESGYVASGAECAPNVYSFLMQFFTMFPEYRNNDFYCGGVSYGGIYGPEAAHYIHTKNNENPELMINLKGVLLETPWVDPRSQMVYGDFLYHTGLIGETDRNHFLTEEARILEFIESESYLEGQEIFENLVFGNLHGTYFNNVSGYSIVYNILKDQPVPSDESWIELVTSVAFRNAVHVGNLSFTSYSALVERLFRPNILIGTKPLVENLLESGYKVLIYSGQLDIITNHIGVDQMMKNLEWSGAQEYNNAPRTIWKVDDRVAGYVQSARNLTQVVVTKAGHGSAEDQPKNVFELLNKFTGDVPFN